MLMANKIASLTERDIEIHEKKDISNAMKYYFVQLAEVADEIQQSPNPHLVGDHMTNDGNKTIGNLQN